MLKKILLFLLFLSCLAGCISIRPESGKPAHSANFVTATLAPTLRPWRGQTTSTLPPEAIASGSPAAAFENCSNSAILIQDVTIPDNTQMQAGEKFTKTWEFQNTGTCSWKGYTLQFFSGDQMDTPLSIQIPDTVPNGTTRVSVDLTAPAPDGIYTAYFILKDATGKPIPIGRETSFWVKIRVGNVVLPRTNDAVSTRPLANPACAYSENAGYVSEIISRINQARADADAPVVAVNAQLTAAAQGHSADMACANLLSHTGSDGSSPWERIANTGYFESHAPGFSEIIAIGTPLDAMNQWQADPGHWEFVINPGVTEIGVGYAYFSGSDYGGYFTVDFGS